MNFVLSHFVSVLCSITKVIKLLAIDAILLKKKSEKLEVIPLQGCITVPIISLTSRMEEGDSDIISIWLFFIFTCSLILLMKDIFIKCLYTF